MSTYVTMSGYIEYKDKKTLDNNLQLLKQNGYINDELCWVDEVGELISDEPSFIQNSIIVPTFCYRNLYRLNNDLTKDSERHCLDMVCTDGCVEISRLMDHIETDLMPEFKRYIKPLDDGLFLKQGLDDELNEDDYGQFLSTFENTADIFLQKKYR
jgi:hypothetical protein